MAYKQKFSAFLRIQLAGQSQADLARGAGITETVISRWLADKTLPSFESCLRVARYFNISPTHLFHLIRRKDLVDLYNWFLPDFEPKELPLAAVYRDNGVRQLHETLDKIIAASSGKKTDMDIPSLVSSLLINISEFSKT